MPPFFSMKCLLVFLKSVCFFNELYKKNMEPFCKAQALLQDLHCCNVFFGIPFSRPIVFLKPFLKAQIFLINCQLWKALLQGLPPPMPLRKSFNLASSSWVSAEFPSHHCQQWGLALPLASASHPSSTPPFVLCRFHKKQYLKTLIFETWGYPTKNTTYSCGTQPLFRKKNIFLNFACGQR